MLGILLCFVVGFFAYFDYGMVPAILISLLVLFGVICCNNADNSE